MRVDVLKIIDMIQKIFLISFQKSFAHIGNDGPGSLNQENISKAPTTHCFNSIQRSQKALIHLI